EPLGAIAVHVSLVIIGRKPTSGGSSDTDVNDPTVKPVGVPSALPDTIVTPVGKCPSTVRNCLLSKAATSLAPTTRRGPGWGDPAASYAALCERRGGAARAAGDQAGGAQGDPRVAPGAAGSAGAVDRALADRDRAARGSRGAERARV